MSSNELKALIFDIKRDCSEDGPGIRTTVFFKGCPMSCVWCQNPEARISHEVSGSPVECELSEDEPGEWVDLDTLLYRVLIDKPFFDASGGGVTLSGGEVTGQMKFASVFLKALKDLGVHTAIETSGFFNYRRFRTQMLPYIDLIYFDIKLIDETASRRYTGQSSHLILDNFEKLIEEAQIPVIPRIPLIPEITATRENLAAIAQFLGAHGVTEVSLMPYNPLWYDKLEKLGQTAKYHRKTFMTPQERRACIDIFSSAFKGMSIEGIASLR